jgi:hypothetical protein
MESSDGNKTASDSIRGKLEFDSNAIDESVWQNEKQNELRMSRLLPMNID